MVPGPKAPKAATRIAIDSPVGSTPNSARSYLSVEPASINKIQFFQRRGSNQFPDPARAAEKPFSYCDLVVFGCRPEDTFPKLSSPPSPMGRGIKREVLLLKTDRSAAVPARRAPPNSIVT